MLYPERPRSSFTFGSLRKFRDRYLDRHQAVGIWRYLVFESAGFEFVSGPACLPEFRFGCGLDLSLRRLAPAFWKLSPRSGSLLRAFLPESLLYKIGYILYIPSIPYERHISRDLHGRMGPWTTSNVLFLQKGYDERSRKFCGSLGSGPQLSVTTMMLAAEILRGLPTWASIIAVILNIISRRIYGPQC